ncbi:MAG: hypothetical protein J6Y01_04465 [Spirochaetales bacterium]|nr:hypothetical protein [Spirochaetales bacterium]
MNTYLDQLFSANHFTDIHQAVSFISRFTSSEIFAEFNKILNGISPDDELFLRHLLHIVDEYPHKIDMLISSLAMYSYSTEISDFQNTLNILRRYITHIPKNNEDYSEFLHNIEQVNFSDENEIQKFILTNKIKNNEPEITEEQSDKKNPLNFLKKFPFVNFFNKIITKNKASEEDEDNFVQIKSDEPQPAILTDNEKTKETNNSPLIAAETDSGYDAYKSMIERIGYEESVVADEIITSSSSEDSPSSTDSLLQEEKEEDTFVSLRADDDNAEEPVTFSPISLQEEEVGHEDDTKSSSDDFVSSSCEETLSSAEIQIEENDYAPTDEEIDSTIVPTTETEETPQSSIEPIETAATEEETDDTFVPSDELDTIVSTTETEEPTPPIELAETTTAEEETDNTIVPTETEEEIPSSDENLFGIAEEKTSSEVFSSAIPNPLSMQRIEYRNRITQALLEVYHDKKTGYKLLLGLFRGLDVFRRMCLTGEEFNKELFMRNFRKYLTHFPDANLITLCHQKVPDIDEAIISQHIINCMKILNHHVDKTRFKLLFEDKLNLRSGFNWEYQQRITWLYFPEKRKPKRDIDEIYAVKSVTDGTASKTENTKVKKYRSYISMLSSRDITLANQILGVLHTIYYKRRDCKRFLFHIFKSLDEYDLSAFELTPKQKAIFEANFNKTVLNTNKNPDYPNIFKMIVQNNPKIKPREIESLLPVCIRIMKEKIDIGFERKKRKQPDLANSFNPLEKYSQIYEKKLFIIYKTV